MFAADYFPVQVSSANLARLIGILLPPSPDTLAQHCKQVTGLATGSLASLSYLSLLHFTVTA